jgi:hypothetical protein
VKCNLSGIVVVAGHGPEVVEALRAPLGGQEKAHIEALPLAGVGVRISSTPEPRRMVERSVPGASVGAARGDVPPLKMYLITLIELQTSTLM